MTKPKVSHGRSVGAMTVGPYTVTEAFYAPYQSVALHAHAWASWTFVLSGSFEERFGSYDAVCSSGVVLTKSATAAHSNVYGSKGAHCLIIETRDSVRERETAGVFGRPKIFSTGLLPALARQIHNEFESPDATTFFSLESLLIELAGATGRSSNSVLAVGKKAWLNKVREQLEAEFRSPPPLAELAEAHGVHPVYLCQAFRAAFGVSVGQFARAVRFEWTRDALRLGVGSISDVALAAGFSDQAHFSRDFKRNAGISPYRFRRAG
jgi:AraC-like DNA-binding protein